MAQAIYEYTFDIKMPDYNGMVVFYCYDNVSKRLNDALCLMYNELEAQLYATDSARSMITLTNCSLDNSSSTLTATIGSDYGLNIKAAYIAPPSLR